MAFDVTKLAKLSHVQDLANRVKSKIDALETLAGDSIKKVEVSGNTLNFYTDKTPAQGATPAYSIDFPAEMVLDQAQTTFVDSFVFSTATYGTATTNPNLDGKPVLVLAVKTTDAQNNVSLNYSFLNVEKLVDVYEVASDTTSSRVLDITDNKITFKLSTDADNALETDASGLKVNISGKAARDTDAIENNIAKFDANGNPIDSGIAASEVVLSSTIATNAEAAEMLETIFPTIQGGGE